jgi:hypothetical protein
MLLLLSCEIVRPFQVDSALLVPTRRLGILSPVGKVIVVNNLVGIEAFILN